MTIDKATLRELASDERVIELAHRLVASGPKAAHVSASETHEIAECILEVQPQLSALLDQLDQAEAKHDELSQRVQDTLAAWTDDINKRVAPFVAIVEAAKAWRACFDDEGEICNRIALGDIEVKLADAIDAATPPAPDKSYRGDD